MNQEIINVLNYLGEKLGIAIDWTSENVWPQVMDILERYRLFELVNIGFWLIVEIVMAICAFLLFKGMAKDYMKIEADHEDNFWWYRDYGSSDLSIFGLVLLIISVIAITTIIAAIIISIIIWIVITVVIAIRRLIVHNPSVYVLHAHQSLVLS